MSKRGPASKLLALKDLRDALQAVVDVEALSLLPANGGEDKFCEVQALVAFALQQDPGRLTYACSADERQQALRLLGAYEAVSALLSHCLESYGGPSSTFWEPLRDTVSRHQNLTDGFCDHLEKLLGLYDDTHDNEEAP